MDPRVWPIVVWEWTRWSCYYFLNVGWMVCPWAHPEMELLTWSDSSYTYLLIISHVQNAVISTGTSVIPPRASHLQSPYISIRVLRAAGEIKQNTTLASLGCASLSSWSHVFPFRRGRAGKSRPHLLSPASGPPPSSSSCPSAGRQRLPPSQTWSPSCLTCQLLFLVSSLISLRQLVPDLSSNFLAIP